MKGITLIKSAFNFVSLILIAFLLMTSSQRVQAETADAQCANSLTVPHLVIGIDGVSYDTFNKSLASGHFTYLNSVVPMISSFPSISDPNWSRMLGAPLIESYTMEHFSPNIPTRRGMGKKVGGLYLGLNPPLDYFKIFDNQLTVIDRLAMYTFVETSARSFIRRVIRDYHRVSPSAPSYKVLLESPDVIAHLRDEEGVLNFLKYLDHQLVQLIHQIQDTYNRTPPITFLSDHGNAFVDTKYIQYERHLKDKGWNLASTLASDDDVAIVLSEILSFGAFYTKPDKPDIAIDLAQDMRDMKGADIVAASPGPHTVVIFKQQEEAVIYIDPSSSKVTYTPTNGDPLKQKHLFQGGPLDFEDYLFKSYGTDYPYAAVTLWEAFHRNTLEAADVLVSTKPDWAMAGQTLYWLSKLQGKVKSLHGALHGSAARGIFATTEHFPYPAISVDGVRDFLKAIDSSVELSSH